MLPIPTFVAAHDSSSACHRPEFDLGNPDIRSLPVAALAIAIALASWRDGGASVLPDGGCAVRPGAGDNGGTPFDCREFSDD